MPFTGIVPVYCERYVCGGSDDVLLLLKRKLDRMLALKLGLFVNYERYLCFEGFFFGFFGIFLVLVLLRKQLLHILIEIKKK